jgi:signal transduction histidine kinase
VDTRDAFLAEPARICEVLKAMTAELPFSLILVLDQAEEMFTLVGSDGNAGSSGEPRSASRDAMLEALRRLALQPSNIKVIVSLRTEFCGRLLAHLRRGAIAVPGIREYMLTELDEEAIIEAVGRPTLDTPLRYGGQVPFETYGFRYGEGVARMIALESRSVGQRDSVLPLVQFLCDQLYHLVKGRSDPTVTVADFQAIGGVKGGLRFHIENQIKIVVHDDSFEAEALKSLLHRLVHRQPDGTLSTDLVREEDLRSRWSGRRAFEEIIESAERMRLIRFNSRRRDDGSEERSLSLGHDAMTTVLEAWHREQKQRETQEEAQLLLTIVNGLVHSLNRPGQGISDRILQLHSWVQGKRDLTPSQLSELVADLTDFSQEIGSILTRFGSMVSITDNGSLKPQLFFDELDCARLMERAVRKWQRTASKRQIRIELPSRKPFLIEGDEEALSVVFDNLIDNAVKFARDGSVVRVSISDFNLPMSPAWHLNQPGWRFGISDVGLGIDPEEIDLVFKPYVRGKAYSRERVIHGAGLGLSICKILVELHGGAIVITSEKTSNPDSVADPDGLPDCRVDVFVDLPIKGPESRSATLSSSFQVLLY